MSDPAEMTPRELLNKIITDRSVSAEQVHVLGKHLKKDWLITRHEVEALFRCNQAIDHADQKCPEWIEFFAQSVGRLIVMDLDSPGEIDVSEGDWLADMCDKYLVGNEAEEKLFFELQNTARIIAGRVGERLQPFS